MSSYIPVRYIDSGTVEIRVNVRRRFTKTDKSRAIRKVLDYLVQSGLRKRKYVEGRFFAYKHTQGYSLAIAVAKTCQDFSRSQPEVLQTVCNNLLSLCTRSEDVEYIKNVLNQSPSRHTYGIKVKVCH